MPNISGWSMLIIFAYKFPFRNSLPCFDCASFSNVNSKNLEGQGHQNVMPLSQFAAPSAPPAAFLYGPSNAEHSYNDGNRGYSDPNHQNGDSNEQSDDVNNHQREAVVDVERLVGGVGEASSENNTTEPNETHEESVDTEKIDEGTEAEKMVDEDSPNDREDNPNDYKEELKDKDQASDDDSKPLDDNEITPIDNEKPTTENEDESSDDKTNPGHDKENADSPEERQTPTKQDNEGNVDDNNVEEGKEIDSVSEEQTNLTDPAGPSNHLITVKAREKSDVDTTQ